MKLLERVGLPVLALYGVVVHFLAVGIAYAVGGLSWAVATFLLPVLSWAWWSVKCPFPDFGPLLAWSGGMWAVSAGLVMLARGGGSGRGAR